jgi:hypothetical protein
VKLSFNDALSWVAETLTTFSLAEAEQAQISSGEIAVATATGHLIGPAGWLPHR